MNFNVDNVNKKIVLVFSFIGFILSLLAGIFSGNNFINILFHSILSSIIIGGIVFGANIVVMVYLPELLTNDNDSEDGEEDSAGQVDIVMPEEGYTVQSEDENFTNATGSSVSTNSSEDISEVGLDNLQSMSNSGMPEEAYINDSVSSGDDEGYSSNSVTHGDVPMGEHSVEDMAKAVKTVLKRD